MPKEVKKKDDLDKFQTLPQAVRDFLLSSESSKLNIGIFKKFKLSPEQKDLYFLITDKVIYKEIKLEDFSATVEKEFGFDKEKSRQLSLEILGKVFLPLDSYLGDSSEVIKKLGGNPNKFTIQHVELQKITPEDLLKKVMGDADTFLQDASAQRRLKNIIINRFNGVRDDEETLATLMRGNKVGGLGLSEEGGRKMIQSIRAKMGAFKLVEKYEMPTPLPAKKVPVKSSTTGAPPDNLPIKKGSVAEVLRPPRGSIKASATPVSKSKKPDIIYGAEEEREIAHHQRELEKKQIVDKAIKFNEEVEKSIQNILEKGKLKFSDENLKQRFLKVVSARLRDVRDKNETLELFLRKRSMGGLGLKEESANKILNLIETEFESLIRLRKKGELQKLEEWKKTREDERKNKEEKDEDKEKKVLEKKWVRLTGGARPHRKTEKQKNRETEKPPVAPTKIPPTPPSVPPIAPPKSSPPSKPKVESVKFTPRLIGPVDELRRMTMVDFKRLAKNPKDAIEKIKDKIELLEDESYTKKLAGIKAWQESEPSKIYFEILNQSMSEMASVAEILAQRTEKKLPNLTKEEFNALMELNKELRV